MGNEGRSGPGLSIRMQGLPEPTCPACLGAAIASSQPPLAPPGTHSLTPSLCGESYSNPGLSGFKLPSQAQRSADVMYFSSTNLHAWCRDVEGAGVGSLPNPKAQVGAAVRSPSMAPYRRVPQGTRSHRIRPRRPVSHYFALWDLTVEGSPDLS